MSMRLTKFALTILIVSISFHSTVHAQADSAPSFAFRSDFNKLEPGNVNAVQAYTKLQENADAAYKEKSYKQAYKYYLKLAEFGDKFSQYRIAYMHYNGLGVAKDPVQAYAWSYVSAETKKKGLVNYHVSIKQKLNDSQKSQAQELAEEYHDKYGLYSVAHNARMLIKQQKKKCVGSRLGNSCDRISSVGITCNAFENNLPSNECLTLGAVGLPGIAGMQPKDVRLVENNLADIMRQYSPGTVELRDLQIIEDEES